MHSTFATLIDYLDRPCLDESGVISWASPVPAFGDVSTAQIATVGLNPSNREFVDIAGLELDGDERRFHTLGSLGLSEWSKADARHIKLMNESCARYFSRNPYDVWFKPLEQLLAPTSFSLYQSGACHLDLIPYATADKWTDLSSKQRKSLLSTSAHALALLLADSPIRAVILNGRSVVTQFEEMSGTKLRAQEMRGWSLPRRREGVRGYSYSGFVDELAGVSFPESILVLGYNHNIQSSFGVTRQVTREISGWIAERLAAHLEQ